MNLSDLKLKIKSKSLDDSLLVFKYEENKWLLNSYIKAIAELKNREIIYSNELENYYENDIYLYVVELKELDLLTYLKYKEKYKNLILICNKLVDEKSIDFVYFPKLEQWQIVDYIKVNLVGLKEEEAKELLNLSKGDIYLVSNEIDKLKLFNRSDQPYLFNTLKKENNYNNADDFTKFTLTNYLVNKEINKINTFLYFASNFEPMSLVGILLRQFKIILKIQMSNNKNDPSKIGLDFKQYNMNKKFVNLYTNESLIKKVKFLTDIDYKLKSGLLDMNNITLFDYVLCNVINL